MGVLLLSGEGEFSSDPGEFSTVSPNSSFPLEKKVSSPIKSKVSV